jgi:hypothetical protein
MKNIDNPSEKIIIALDGMDKDDVVNLLKKIPEIVWVKVGLELFVTEGPDVLSMLSKGFASSEVWISIGIRFWAEAYTYSFHAARDPSARVRKL